VFSCPGCRGQSAVITGSLGLVEAQDPERELIERALGRPVAATARAAWGFTNRTDMVTLADGQRAVVQRYRHREDAGYRLRVMQGRVHQAAKYVQNTPALTAKTPRFGLQITATLRAFSPTSFITQRDGSCRRNSAHGWLTRLNS
jgi:hypothetical protein